MDAKSQRLILIANRFTQPEVGRRVLDAVRGGVRVVQLRDHDASPIAFRQSARTLVAELQSRGVTVLLNTRLHVARTLNVGMHVGMHVGTRGPSPREVRAVLGQKAQIGYSAHDLSEAQRQGVDYLSYSPVFPTRSKPGHPGVGLLSLSRFCKTAAPTPVYALGGIEPGNVRACIDAGAFGITVLSGILHADAPYSAARSYRQAIRRAVGSLELHTNRLPP